jgi:hypothetical protein
MISYTAYKLFNFIVKYLGEFESIFEKAKIELFIKETNSQKSRDRVPFLKGESHEILVPFFYFTG